jgi:RNA 2',3'-cyclic 3'-phosphodiesterase
MGIRARWVGPEKIHLTLTFLGSIPAGHVESIGRTLMEAARAHSPLSLTAVGTGIFPGLRRPRVIWVGIADRTDALGGLKREIDARLAALGFPAETARFRGHLTIGRFAAGGSPGPLAQALKQYAGQAAGAFEVREVILFRSDLRKAPWSRWSGSSARGSIMKLGSRPIVERPGHPHRLAGP